MIITGITESRERELNPFLPAAVTGINGGFPLSANSKPKGMLLFLKSRWQPRKKRQTPQLVAVSLIIYGHLHTCGFLYILKKCQKDIGHKVHFSLCKNINAKFTVGFSHAFVISHVLGSLLPSLHLKTGLRCACTFKKSSHKC